MSLHMRFEWTDTLISNKFRRKALIMIWKIKCTWSKINVCMCHKTPLYTAAHRSIHRWILHMWKNPSISLRKHVLCMFEWIRSYASHHIRWRVALQIKILSEAFLPPCTQQFLKKTCNVWGKKNKSTTGTVRGSWGSQLSTSDQQFTENWSIIIEVNC